MIKTNKRCQRGCGCRSCKPLATHNLSNYTIYRDGGWTPLERHFEYSSTVTLREIYDWFGGEGPIKPNIYGYVYNGGVTDDPDLAAANGGNVRGPGGGGGGTSDIYIGPNGNWFIDGIDTGVSATGPQGDNGWTPETALVVRGAGVVEQVVDWIGGSGTKPPTGQYKGPTGWVTNINDATNVRGPEGSGGGGGTGGMDALIYDPNLIQENVYDRQFHIGVQSISTITGLQGELDDKELLANKVLNFLSPDNSTYPTTQAVVDYVSSNIPAPQTLNQPSPGEISISGGNTIDLSSAFLPSSGGTVTGQIKRDSDALVGDDLPRLSQVQTLIANTPPSGVSWSEITGKPSTFPPSAHNHDAGDINAGILDIDRVPTGTTGTTVALGNHTHTFASITSKPTTISGYGISDSYTKDEVDGLISGGGLGTVTSVGIEAPVGLSVSNSPITSSGVINIGLQTGYSIPTTSSQSNWDEAFGWGDHDGLYRPVSWTPTWAEVSGKPSTFTPSTHTHNAGDIDTGIFDIARIPTGTTSSTVALGNDSRINNGQTAFGWGDHAGLYRPISWTPSWGDVTGKPSTFTPASHTHNADDINSGVLGIDRIPTGSTGSTVALGNDSRINNGQTAFGWGDHSLAGYLQNQAYRAVIPVTANRTLQSDDFDSLYDVTGTRTLTLPSDLAEFPVRARVDILIRPSSTLNINAGGGVTLVHIGGTGNTSVSGYAMISIVRVYTNEYAIAGG